MPRTRLHLAIAAPALIAVALAACAKSQSERMRDAALDEIKRAPEVPLAPLSLAPVGADMIIDAPLRAVPMTRFNSWLVSTAARDFAVVIDRAHGSLADRKKVIAENPDNKLVAYLVARNNALLYQTRRQGAAEDEYHVLVHVELRGVAYLCQDDKRERFIDVAAAHTMLRACQSLRPGEAAP